MVVRSNAHDHIFVQDAAEESSKAVQHAVLRYFEVQLLVSVVVDDFS